MRKFALNAGTSSESTVMPGERTTERFRSDELGTLMARVQELLEADVLAMVVRHPSGRISVTCPPQCRDGVVALLRQYDWASLDQHEHGRSDR